MAVEVYTTGGTTVAIDIAGQTLVEPQPKGESVIVEAVAGIKGDTGTTGPTGPRGPIGVGVEAIIQSGNLVQKNNVLPPGQRIAADMTIQEAHLRMGTAPAGQDAIVRINRTRAGTTTALATYSITAGTNSASFTGLTWSLLKGDVITYDVTQTGTTTIGADLAAQLVGTGG